MPPVGRPRTTTRKGNRAPTQELGVPDNYLGGFGISGLGGTSGLIQGTGPWHMYVDEWEYVPELRWPLSIRLFDQMRTDSQLAALLTGTMWGITQLRYVIDPNGCPTTMVKEVSEDLNLPIMGKDDQPLGRMKGRFTHRAHVHQAMLAVLYGHMYFNQVGEIVNGKWRLRKLAPRMPQTIAQINVADDGGLVSIMQYPPPGWIPPGGAQPPMSGIWGPEIPVDNLTAFVFQQEGMSWTGRSMIRDCYRDWLAKDRLMRIEMINHERAGGVPWAEGAQGMTVDEITDLDQMMRQFRIGDTAGGALPYGAKLNIARGTGSDVDRTIKRYDESMARRFLLMLVNLAQGGQHVGSYALGEAFEDFFIIGQRNIAQWYCDVMTEHLIEDIVDWNYGEDQDLTPRITWERSSEDSLGTEQLSMLVDKGIVTMDQETENWVRYRYLLPKKTEPRPEITMGGPQQPYQQRAERLGQLSGTEPGIQPVTEGQNPTPGGGAPAPTQAAGDSGSGAPSLPSPADHPWWRRMWRR